MNGNGFNGYATSQGYDTGMGAMQPMSYVQQGRITQPLMTNPLTAEEEKLLITEQDTFDLKVQPKEVAEAVCTHKKDGRFQIVPTENGMCICKLCKAQFNPSVVTEIYVQDSVDNLLNTLQTCKMIAVDMNNDVVRQFFQIIPYITRIPKLYSMLVRIFEKYNMQNPVQPVGAPNAVALFNNIMNPAVPITQPMMDPYGYNYNMPVMQQNMVAGNSPLYQQPPVMNPPYGVPATGYPQQSVMDQTVMNNMQQPPMGQPQMLQQVPPQQNTQQPSQQQTPQQVQVKEQLQL